MRAAILCSAVLAIVGLVHAVPPFHVDTNAAPNCAPPYPEPVVCDPVRFFNEIKKIFIFLCATFFHGKSYEFKFDFELSHILGDFFTNSSGHPGIKPQYRAPFYSSLIF
jgi:hypothetical protein